MDFLPIKIAAKLGLADLPASSRLGCITASYESKPSTLPENSCFIAV